MKTRWSEEEAHRFSDMYAPQWGKSLALRTYASRLLGQDETLVLHGGGNTSVKGETVSILGEATPTLFVKASGWDLAHIEPEGHAALDLTRLQPLATLASLHETDMTRLLRTSLLDPTAATPSIETLLHAFLPHTFIDHTHPDAILTLTNQRGGTRLVAEALGTDVLVLPYVHPGFDLAKAVDQALTKAPHSRAMVLMKHGLLTWGETAQASYETTIDLVNRAETYIAQRIRPPLADASDADVESAWKRYHDLAPRLRGTLATPTHDPDRPHHRVILRPLITAGLLSLLKAPAMRNALVSAPLTSDHLIRTKPWPLWIENPTQWETALANHRDNYLRYVTQESDNQPPETTPEVTPWDSTPRILLIPGVGVVCLGRDHEEASIVRDLARQTIAAKSMVVRMGGVYEGVSPQAQFAMEFFPPQRAKLRAAPPLPLAGQVAWVTGSAGAIGSGICRMLLNQGAHLALSDLPGGPLDTQTEPLRRQHGGRVLPVAMDVTDPDAVQRALKQIIQTWGGLDLLVLNAGLAHVASLAEMQPEMFHRVQRVNTDGTLHLLSAMARHTRIQGTGGDIVLISTKNVFAPGANFAAYSATKAAAHQLARIAALELAPLGVRVNMVAPDGVFSDGDRPSGLWAEVGPARMRARGLDADGLEAYYQDRNLLKARITATHVARAVLFFATRQTPTTGVTLPVDGGLPDATPR